jgi:hypothetical protein
MTPTQEIDYILCECFAAVGQAIGPARTLDFDAVVWWHTRYHRAFLQAMANGNSWARDRRRVTAVGRYLGQRALHHAQGSARIDVRAAVLASLDIEAACQMNAERDGLAAAAAARSEARCTDSASAAF